MRLSTAAFLCGLVLAVSPANALWPAPKAMTNGSTPVQLSSAFQISFSGSLQKHAPADLVDAVKRTHIYLAKDDMQRLVVGRGDTDRPAVIRSQQISKLELSLASSKAAVLSVSDEAHKAYEDQDESYILTIPSGLSKRRVHGSLSATLTANTTLGLARGLTTFTQLVYSLPTSKGHESATRYILDTPISISDAPSFPHRAFMLDTSRNFFPVSDILRTLDAMSWAKLNVFHWHATDSQAWPLTIPAYPKLTQEGAYSSKKVYSRSDIAYIQSYAGALGITVLLEIDTPGHTASIANAYPEFIACADKNTEWTTYANQPPTGQLKLGDPATQKFAETMMKSASSMMTSKYFSSGGDEVNANCYTSDPTTSVAMVAQNKTLDGLLFDFVVGIHKTLRDAGKTPVVWEEMVLEHALQLGNDTIVTVWISSANVKAVADKGYRIVHGASDYFYLDCGGGGWVGDGLGSGAENSWCDPFKGWQKMYSFDPYASLTEDQHSLVLGGESLLWTEQSDPNNLDAIVWPRAAAAAEIFWTGPTLPDGTARNGREALPRLHDWRYRAVARGVKAIALQPEYCALRPQVCNL